MSENVIEVRGLTVDFPLRAGNIRAVNHVNFDIPKGKITALVGESGSGKSTMASAILRSVSSPGLISSGEIFYQGEDVLKYNKEKMQRFKWSKVSMVFQAAQNALNPVMTIREQVIETVRAHDAKITEKKILDKAKELLEYVRLEPGRVLAAHPHELSGGMKQRVMIAFSLLLNPELVILDEPTTALDVITQAYIFDILAQIHEDMGTTMLLMTHDIGVVARFAERVGVMYAGRLVEVGDVYSIFDNADHPYTSNLMKSVPSLLSNDDLQPIVGSTPNLLNLPSGCPFHPRCKQAKPVCKRVDPVMVETGVDHLVNCHIHSNEEYAREQHLDLEEVRV
ncbi:ABC transporter ATP-binding protein [Alicyclobacillus fodiniaquatilis]|uniref:Nickel import system ATP-binding protein NikD n=1 Tax=Alicyclobacillus fodiniaquatilis TaxID=1661150 RepID=A0ABW4JMA1_9BACL